MKRAILPKCRSAGCTSIGGAKVSTADRCYGFASAVGAYHNYEPVVSRPSKRSRRWRVRFVIGGGAPSCEEMLEAVPPRVVRDFGLKGRLGQLARGLEIGARAVAHPDPRD